MLNFLFLKYKFFGISALENFLVSLSWNFQVWLWFTKSFSFLLLGTVSVTGSTTSKTWWASASARSAKRDWDCWPTNRWWRCGGKPHERSSRSGRGRLKCASEFVWPSWRSTKWAIIPLWIAVREGLCKSASEVPWTIALYHTYSEYHLL